MTQLVPGRSGGLEVGGELLRARARQLAANSRAVATLRAYEVAALAEVRKTSTIRRRLSALSISLKEIETQLLNSGQGLRSKTPELVRQEFWALLLAHYAIRTLMTEAADTAELDPDRLSFIRTLNIVRRHVTNQAGSSPRNLAPGTH